MTRISAIVLRWHNSPHMAQKIEREALAAGWVSPEAHEAAVTRAEKAEASLRESDAALQAAREEIEKAECATRYQKSLCLQAERFQMDAEAEVRDLLTRLEAAEESANGHEYWHDHYKESAEQGWAEVDRLREALARAEALL